MHYLDIKDSDDLYSMFMATPKEGRMSIPLSMELDSGAAVSLVNKTTYHMIRKSSQLNPL